MELPPFDLGGGLDAAIASGDKTRVIEIILGPEFEYGKQRLSCKYSTSYQYMISLAASSGHTDLVQWFIDNARTISERVNHWTRTFAINSALFEAVSNSHVDVVKLLLSQGADVNLSHDMLEVAVSKGNIDVVKLLVVNAKALREFEGWRKSILMSESPRAKIADMEFPFEASKMLQRVTSREMLEYLLELFCDDGLAGFKSNVVKASKVLESVAAADNVSLMVWIIEQYKPWRSIKRAFCDAALSGANQVVSFLLRHYGKHVPKTAKAKGLTLAAMNGRSSVVRTILRFGQCKQPWKDDALAEAAEAGETEIVSVLLDAGANIHANGNDALVEAASCGKLETVQLLVARGANVRKCNNLALVCAAMYGKYDVVEFLLNNGAKVNSRALREATNNKHDSVAKLLLDRGARDEDKDKDKDSDATINHPHWSPERVFRRGALSSWWGYSL